MLQIFYPKKIWIFVFARATALHDDDGKGQKQFVYINYIQYTRYKLERLTGTCSTMQAVISRNH